MLETDRWCSVGKQASRKSLKPTDKGVKTRCANRNTPRLDNENKNTVQDDTLRVRESPALEDVRELISSGDKAADAGELVAATPPELLDEIPEDDKVIKTQEPSSGMISTNNQVTPTDESSLDTEAMASSEVSIFAHEATKVDNDVVVTHAVSGDADNMLANYDTKSAAHVLVPFGHKDTVDAEAAVTVEHTSNKFSGESPFPSLPEASSIDNVGLALLALEKTVKAMDEGMLDPQQQSPDLLLRPSVDASTPKRTSPRKKSNIKSPHTVTTPGANPKLLISAESLRPDNLGETPQIGTSLLRRESLRRKESPSTKRHARKSKTPKRKDTLQRRDTLQEREILQKVIAETTADHSDEIMDALPIEMSTLPSPSFTAGAEETIRGDGQSSSEPFLREEEPNSDTVAHAEAVSPVVNEINVEKDLHRAMEAIEVYEHPSLANASQHVSDITSGDSQGMVAMDKANEVLAKTELDDVSQATKAIREQTPNPKTRSTARFSDDTTMLKDFLNRAQARKAAQKPLLSAPDAPIPQNSPRRSPRKMHGSQDGQGSSPQKPRNSGSRPDTPPMKLKPEAFDSDDGEEHNAEPASCRRSTRRLPAPSKALPGAPSFIPVRRADGVDPVVLQKSQAQELAVTTRANTRRNKGQSKPPLLALQDLASESTDLATTVKQGGEKGKSVGWAERLASYRDANGESDEIEERRPKVRRLRGLGAANGTPTAKRTTAVVSSTPNGTAAAKRRGKV